MKTLPILKFSEVFMLTAGFDVLSLCALPLSVSSKFGGHAVGSAWFLCTLTGNCPSFADMGMALEQLLTGEGATEQEVTSSISPEFQLLLSWCWLNLKAGVDLILSF